MVKKRGIVWNYYNKKVAGSQVIAFCKFCDQSYIQNATRMERHMERCPKCPDDIKQQFIQAAHNKKHKASVMGAKLSAGWPKQESSVDQDVDDGDWNDWSPYMPGSETIPTYDQCYNYDTTVRNNNESASSESRDCDSNRSNAEPLTNAGPGEGSQTVHQRKCDAPRKTSELPLLSTQSKILREQLLERRALRRAAELELKRKTLECERLQWEYERDKARWAHESRMMQLKEERERQTVAQTKSRKLPLVV